MLSFPKQYIKRITGIQEQKRIAQEKQLESLRMYEKLNKLKMQKQPESTEKAKLSKTPKSKDLSVGKQKTCPNPTLGAPIIQFKADQSSPVQESILVEETN